MAPEASERPVDNPDRRIVIIGAGTYSAPIVELAEACGYSAAFFLDDNAERIGTIVDGLEVRGPTHEVLRQLPAESNVAVAIGDNRTRLRLLRLAVSLGHRVPALISPEAYVSPTAQVADAVYLHPRSVTWSHATLGFGTILSVNTLVGHHTTLDEGCFVALGAGIGSSLVVGVGVFFGGGSTTSLTAKQVGDYTVVGAGAVVIRNTEPFGVYVGNPAKQLVRPGS